MRRRQFLTLSVAAIAVGGYPLCPASAHIDETTPFGLRWGASRKDLEASGAKLKEYRTNGKVLSYQATNLPLGEADAESLMLHFGTLDRFYQLALLSRVHRDDPTGGDVLLAYNELLAELVQKFGPSRPRHTGDNHGPTDWAAQILNGKAVHEDKFVSNGVNIWLRCVAIGPAETGWVLAYTHRQFGKEELIARLKQPINPPLPKE